MPPLFKDLLNCGDNASDWGIGLIVASISPQSVIDQINQALLQLKDEKIEELKTLLPLLRYLCLEYKSKPSDAAIEAVLDWLSPFIINSGSKGDVYKFFIDLINDANKKNKLSQSLINKFSDITNALENENKINKALENENIRTLKRAPAHKKKKKEKIFADSNTELLFETPYGGIIQRLETYKAQTNQYAIKAETAKAKKEAAGNWLTKTFYKSKKAYYESKSDKRIKNQLVAKVLINRLENNNEITKSTFFRKDICRNNERLKGHKVHSNELNSIFKSAKKAHQKIQEKSGIFSCCK